MNHPNIITTLRSRLIEGGFGYRANDNISHIYLGELERAEHQTAVEGAVDNLLRCLLIDVDEDHNTKGTARRVAKMFLQETMAGRYTEAPSMTEFPNTGDLDQLMVIGPITVNSLCSHHLQPFIGTAFIGILPSDKVIGLSKFNRLVQHLATRPQIQEELTAQIANSLEKLVDPQGLGVVVRAKHLCCGVRGVKDDKSEFVTSDVRGALREHADLKAEFLNLVRSHSGW